jgi:hypothetical protein
MLHWTTMTRTMGTFVFHTGNSRCANRRPGTQFAYHPEFTNATMIILDPDHPSTTGLPARWRVQDEIYNFVEDPRSVGAKVVVAADETSYVGASNRQLIVPLAHRSLLSLDTGDRSPTQGSPHPIG